MDPRGLLYDDATPELSAPVELIDERLELGSGSDEADTVACVPIAVSTHTGTARRRAALLERATVVAGWGTPYTASVSVAEILSCTAPIALNGGTGQAMPARRTRSAARASNAACSCVGNRQSIPSDRATSKASSNHAKGSSP